MRYEVMKVYSLMIAEMWKEFFEGEGVPCQILPEDGKTFSEFSTYRLLIAREKDHVVREILRKL
ncbi:MAG: hypothetical protein HYY29_04885 [Chloroflexi bacterium]|nr:hypothetical protein [Chloroflexota bacterium]